MADCGKLLRSALAGNAHASRRIGCQNLLLLRLPLTSPQDSAALRLGAARAAGGPVAVAVRAAGPADCGCALPLARRLLHGRAGAADAGRAGYHHALAAAGAARDCRCALLPSLVGSPSTMLQLHRVGWRLLSVWGAKVAGIAPRRSMMAPMTAFTSFCSCLNEDEWRMQSRR